MQEAAAGRQGEQGGAHRSPGHDGARCEPHAVVATRTSQPALVNDATVALRLAAREVLVLIAAGVCGCPGGGKEAAKEIAAAAAARALEVR